MKFIVDAQLPNALAAFLRAQGFDAVQTKDLPNGNDTTDAEINKISLTQRRVIISKDGDFYDSFSAKKEPYKLLYVKTGNISNSELINVFRKNLPTILTEIRESDVVTIDQRHLIALHRFEG